MKERKFTFEAAFSLPSRRWILKSLLGLHGKNVRTENEMILKRMCSACCNNTSGSGPYLTTIFLFPCNSYNLEFNEFTTLHLSQSNA